MKREAKLRVGVIGAGAIAQACHAPGYAKDKRADFVAFADPARARHKEMAERFPGAKGYTCYEAMLEHEHLDAVSVCAPNKFHAPATLAALAAGCHVLCEKPMAITVKETDRMIAAAKAARKKLMIGFTHRLNSGPRACKAYLDEKALGKPFMIRVRFAHGGPHPGWAKDPNTFYKVENSAGGAMLDMGIHALDLVLWLFGPVTAVTAKTATIFKKIPVDDNAVMLLEFANGALGYIEVGWTSKPGFLGLEIYGSEGSLICDYLQGLKFCGGKASAGQDSVTEWKMLDKKPTRGGWASEIGYWLDIVTGKEKLTIDGEAGRAALEVALAAYKSSASGKRVAIR